ESVCRCRLWWYRPICTYPFRVPRDVEGDTRSGYRPHLFLQTQRLVEDLLLNQSVDFGTSRCRAGGGWAANVLQLAVAIAHRFFEQAVESVPHEAPSPHVR